MVFVAIPIFIIHLACLKYVIAITSFSLFSHLWLVLQPCLHMEIDQSHTLLTASPANDWSKLQFAFTIQCRFPFTPKSFLQTLIRLESATIVKFKYLPKQTLFFLLWSLSIFGKNSDRSVCYEFLYWGSPLKLFYNFLPVRKRSRFSEIVR